MAVAMAIEPGQPEPARRVLGQDRDRLVVIEAVPGLHRTGAAPQLEQGLGVQVAEIRTPVEHRGQGGTGAVEHETHACGSELQHVDV